jgi:integrase
MPGIIYAYLRAAFNFWMLRDSKFKSPIIKGMVKENTKLRTRVLKPDEIADLWRVLEGMPAHYAACVKVLLLTGCRRNEIAFMHTDEIDGSTWRIPAERYKTNVAHEVPLIPAIRKLLPKIKNGYVFGCASHRHHLAAGAAPLKSLGNFKEDIDAAIALMRRREHRKPMAPWTYHDLRRTARTMLAELGISDEIAERVLGHSNGKIAEVYNHHKYISEKIDALSKLADHVERITRPTAATTKLRLVAG